MRPAARGSIVRIFKRLRGAAKRRARRLARHGARARPRVTDIFLGSRRETT